MNIKNLIFVGPNHDNSTTENVVVVLKLKNIMNNAKAKLSYTTLSQIYAEAVNNH